MYSQYVAIYPNTLAFYGEEWLTTQLWRQPFVGRPRLFEMSAASLHTWNMSTQSATWERAIACRGDKGPAKRGSKVPTWKV